MAGYTFERQMTADEAAEAVMDIYRHGVPAATVKLDLSTPRPQPGELSRMVQAIFRDAGSATEARTALAASGITYNI